MSAMNLSEFHSLLSALKSADSVLLFTHISPDGDTLGSSLALKIRLLRLGKKANVLLTPPFPSSLRFLPGVERLLTPSSEIPAADLNLAIDVASVSRLGEHYLPIWNRTANTWSIDHHSANQCFSEHLLLEEDAPATGILVYRLLKEMELPISIEEATCLYTAISTDTGNFIYEATSSECFAIISELMVATGMKLGEVSRVLHREKDPAFVRLLSFALQKLQFCMHNTIAGFSLTQEEIHQCQATQGDFDGLIDYAIDIRGVVMAYFLRENGQNQVKCSFRSKAPYDVSEVAKAFGGGGHIQAAGCAVTGDISSMTILVEEAMKKEYRKHE